MHSHSSSVAVMQPSPADSLLSAQDDTTYSPLFHDAAPSPAAATPTDMMSPSGTDPATPSRLSAVPEESASPSPAPGDEKKAAKKRKAWGQVLPEPKTNLPPRKRAKTDDEKEQRRVERILRNRRAAQSSRERKRQEVEALEQRNKELEEKLVASQRANAALLQELHRRGSGALPVGIDSPLKHTLSSQLFGSPDSDLNDSIDATSVGLVSTATVNPASLSPAPSSHAADVEEPTKFTESAQSTAAAPSDLTQRPAAMLCDLQCQSEEARLLADLQSLGTWLPWFLTAASATLLTFCQRPLTQIAMSFTGGFSLRPTPAILATIMWLVTQTTSSRARRSTSTTGSATFQAPMVSQTYSRLTTAPLSTSTSESRVSTLRIRLLRKILSSSPNLARPLMDATFVALRLVPASHDDHVGAGFSVPEELRDVDELVNCLRLTGLPSKEVLLTLLWTIKLEQRRQAKGVAGRSSYVGVAHRSGATRRSIFRQPRDRTYKAGKLGFLLDNEGL